MNTGQHSAESAQNVTSLDQRRELAPQQPSGPPAIEMFMDDARIIFRDQEALDEYVQAACSCGHAAIDHHGSDPADGCLGVASHRLPQCRCRLTCGEVCDGTR